MVRTKANASSVRISAAKAPRKYSTPAFHSSAAVLSPSGKKEKSIGGNPACPRPTPVWQKPVTSFFNPVPRKTHQEPEGDHVEPEGDHGEPQPPEEPSGETNNEIFHDDKENRNPKDAVPASIEDKTDDEPGPSNRSPDGSNPKRRRVLAAESDSEEEIPSKSFGCVTEVEDEITVS